MKKHYFRNIANNYEFDDNNNLYIKYNLDKKIQYNTNKHKYNFFWYIILYYFFIAYFNEYILFNFKFEFNNIKNFYDILIYIIFYLNKNDKTNVYRLIK